MDFGQNVVGWVRLRVRDSEPGQRVTIRHAEVLEGGELGVRPLRAAKATDVHVLAVDQLNTYDVLVNDDVVFTKEAFDALVAGPARGRSAKAVASSDEIEEDEQ